jgi:lipopolysaccharide transport system ATP-binding protein
MEMEIVSVRLIDAAGLPVAEIESGAPLHVVMEYVAPTGIDSPIFGVTISRDDGTICYDTSTEAEGLGLSTVHGRGQVSLHMDRLDLIGAQYYVDVGVYEREWAYAYDYHWHVYPLIVRPTQGEKGILRPPHRWQVQSEPSAADDLHLGSVPSKALSQDER